MTHQGNPKKRLVYGILGTGALGGLYGALLARAGQAVHFLARSDFEHINRSGLRIDTPLGDFHLDDVSVFQSPAQMPKLDVAIVAWKTTANSALQEVLGQMCSPDTIVLVLQNGLNVERDSAEVVGEERVLGGCCFLCSNKVGPGHIHHLDFGRIAFGEFSPSLAGKVTSRMESIASDFELAGIDMQRSENLASVRWKKLAWNIPFNGLSVALGADTQQLMEDPNTAKLAKDLMQEVRQAAAANHIEVPETHIEKMLADTRKMVPYASSMLLDFRHKRPMEVEAIFGNTIRAAKAAGYTPHKIEALYDQLRFIDARNQLDA